MKKYSIVPLILLFLAVLSVMGVPQVAQPQQVAASKEKVILLNADSLTFDA
jgi:hypothetical protein